jgi:hypothetical protein
MDRALDQSFFELVCEQQGIDPEQFKKKHGTKPSGESGTNSKHTQE